MEKVILGKSGLEVSRTAFGALPIQRLDFDTAKIILQRAYDGGITFFDTALLYSDSEEKIAYALADVRKDIILATKCSGAKDRKTVLEGVDISLKHLKTDYIDLLQLHNPELLPDPSDPESLYAGLLEARKSGKVRSIGVTCHALGNALEAARSGLYDTVQFPLSAVSSDEDLELVKICKENNIGLIAMKAMCGGLLTNSRLAFAALRQYENVVPIWGIQRLSELEEFLALEKEPPLLNAELLKELEEEKKALAGEFCRGCGYCLPCPAGIQIPTAARMSFLLERAPSHNWLIPEWQKEMGKIDDCMDCGHCSAHCPYGLDTPALLRTMQERYQAIL